MRVNDLELPDYPRLVAVDTETSALHPDPPENGRVTVVSVAWDDGAEIVAEAFPFAFADTGQQTSLLLEGEINLGLDEWEALMGWLGRRRLVFHGAKFDLHMLWVGLPDAIGTDLRTNLAWDTMLAARDLDGQAEASLEDVELRLDWLDEINRDEWHATKKLRKGLGGLEWARARRYAAWDAEITLAAAIEQMVRYECGEGDWAALRDEMALSNALLGLERRGVGYDAYRSREIAADMKKKEAAIRMSLPFRATLDGARKWFYAPGRVEPLHHTKTGKAQLNDQEVTRLVSLGVEHAEDYRRLRKIETARTKWYEPFAQQMGSDGRLRTVYSQSKVISGRLSSHRVTLQAIPQDFHITEITKHWPSPRDLIKPRPGSKLWELDLSQAELRVAAVTAPCPPMLELIQAEADLHGEVAKELFKIDESHPDWKPKREIGKRSDFSLIFGVGEDTFHQTLAKYDIWLPMGEIRKIITAWRKLFPQYGWAIKRFMDRADKMGYLRLVNGRVRRFASWEDQHKAFNQYVQGSLAELMKLWLLEADALVPETIVLTIHDSLVLEVPDTPGGAAQIERVKTWGERLGTEMFGVRMVVDRKEWEHG